jgi:ABC-type phosphate/phosphonate transport system permease subunit
MAGKGKRSKGQQRSTSPDKTVGVYDRPPQKRPRKPLLIALIIALALVFSIFFLARLSQRHLLQRPWIEEGARVFAPTVQMETSALFPGPSPGEHLWYKISL